MTCKQIAHNFFANKFVFKGKILLFDINIQNTINMRRVLAVGSLCLALGMASCKTYCPAYNYAKIEKDAASTIVAETAVVTSPKANG
jgi:hypothetical protein